MNFSTSRLGMSILIGSSLVMGWSQSIFAQNLFELTSQCIALVNSGQPLSIEQQNFCMQVFQQYQQQQRCSQAYQANIEAQYILSNAKLRLGFCVDDENCRNYWQPRVWDAEQVARQTTAMMQRACIYRM